MKNNLLILTVFFFAIALTAKQGDYYNANAHGFFKQFLGKWEVVYANHSTGARSGGGRGIATSSLEKGETILNFSCELEFKTGEIKSNYIIGRDKFKDEYYRLVIIMPDFHQF